MNRTLGMHFKGIFVFALALLVISHLFGVFLTLRLITHVSLHSQAYNVAYGLTATLNAPNLPDLPNPLARKRWYTRPVEYIKKILRQAKEHITTLAEKVGIRQKKTLKIPVGIPLLPADVTLTHKK